MSHRRRDLDYLGDMIESIERILRYTEGLSLDQFKADIKTQDAAIRNLSVLGEAAGKVSETLLDRSPDIPWRSIRGTRNRLVHDYLGVDYDTVWAIITRDLPVLLQQLQPLRASLQEPGEAQ